MKKWFVVFAFLVSWKAHWLSQTNCSPPPPQVNPYTGEMEYSYTVTTQSCFKDHVKDMSKTLATQKEVDDFKAGCGQPESFDMAVTCTDWKVVQQ